MLDKKNTKLVSALNYAKMGWLVFPLYSIENGKCNCSNENCNSQGKHPRVNNGCHAATLDEDLIIKWWSMWPASNIGVKTGKESGIIVLDVDGEEGISSYDELTDSDDPTPISKTGRGYHYIYAYPNDGQSISCKAGIKSGLDIRGDGGYIVAPPSKHYNGGNYTWKLSPENQPPAELPTTILPMLQVGFDEHNGLETITHANEAIPLGKRNITLTSFAGTFRNKGLNSEDIFECLKIINKSRCQQPLSDREIRSIANSIGWRSMGSNLSDEQIHLTDTGNAKRLVHLSDNNIRFCHLWNKWLIWDGKSWAVDKNGSIMRMAKEVPSKMRQEAARTNDLGLQSKLNSWADKSESSARLEAMIRVAQSEKTIPILPDDLDKDNWKLNVLNGIIDLRTGELYKHRKDDYITILAPVEYEIDAKSEIWDDFLQRVIPDCEVRDFIRRVIGYSLTGDTSEEKLFFIHGPTRTGKSTFVEAIKAMLGDYSKTANFDSFCKKSFDGGIREDIARLVGSRLVSSIEVEEGKHLAEQLIKTITGQDRITVRPLYQSSFEFKPTFKLLLVANNRPRIKVDESALWERIVQIPFCEYIPEDERNPDVKRLLTDPKESGSAILAWAVKGCLEWQEVGLNIPNAVRAYTEEYKEEMDPIKDFLDECCAVDPKQDWTVSKGDLRTTYEHWCVENGEKNPLGRKAFKKVLEEHGIRDDKDTKGIRCWRGLKLDIMTQ